MESSISVIIPTYNRWSLLPRALSSVQNQTHPPIEILIIDDGSDKPVPQAIKDKFPSVQFIRQKNKGVASARNLGIQKAIGTWIALLDSDDEWEPKKLEKQMCFLQKSPELRALHTAERWIRNGNQVTPPNYLDKSSHLLWERSLSHCLICSSSVLLHRSIFETIGYFDESLIVCEDYDFWLRLLLTEKIGLIDEKLVNKHGGHNDQLSTTTWGMDRFRIKSLQKILENKHLSYQRCLLTLEVIINKCRILAQGAKKRGNLDRSQIYNDMFLKYVTTLEDKSMHN